MGSCDETGWVGRLWSYVEFCMAEATTEAIGGATVVMYIGYGDISDPEGMLQSTRPFMQKHVRQVASRYEITSLPFKTRQRCSPK